MYAQHVRRHNPPGRVPLAVRAAFRDQIPQAPITRIKASESGIGQADIAGMRSRHVGAAALLDEASPWLASPHASLSTTTKLTHAAARGGELPRHAILLVKVHVSGA